MASPWLEVEGFPAQWSEERARQFSERLEAGEILYFARPPFEFSEEDRQFLLTQKAAGSRIHKNVSYKPRFDALHGFSADPATVERLRLTMRRYSERVVQFAASLLAPYRQRWTVDFASFRPIEEQGRDLPLHKRNDLLHVDAFPTRPTRGDRILRVFTNLHPEKPRVWVTAERFALLAERFAAVAGLERFAKSGGSNALLRALRLVPNRSAYDRFMLHFHDWLKENAEFQNSPGNIRSEFPPLATWLVYTDGVPHAVLSGQYALEQTFIVHLDALVAPHLAPIRILEKIARRPLSPAERAARVRE